MSFQATKPNFVIWEISVAVLLPNSLCLMNAAIFYRKYAIFFVLLARNSLMPNR